MFPRRRLKYYLKTSRTNDNIPSKSWGSFQKKSGKISVFPSGFPLLLSGDIDIIPLHFWEYFALRLADIIILLQ